MSANALGVDSDLLSIKSGGGGNYNENPQITLTK